MGKSTQDFYGNPAYQAIHDFQNYLLEKRSILISDNLWNKLHIEELVFRTAQAVIAYNKGLFTLSNKDKEVEL